MSKPNIDSPTHIQLVDKKRVTIQAPELEDEIDPNEAKTGLGYTALTKQQRHLLKLVDEGDLFEVEEYLKDNPTLDINGIDYQGRSALTIAIENQNEELVEYFISQNNIRFGDALLRAVKEGNLTVVETLVEAQERRNEMNVKEEPVESAEFAPHITPLLLACLEDHFEIVRFLMSRGHTLKIPSPLDCEDAEIDEEYGEKLENSRARIDSYKALSSSSYMMLNSEDPVLNAFQLAYEAEKMTHKDPIYKNDYEEISDNCRNFSCAVLDQCRSSEEVAIILSQSHSKKDGLGTGTVYPRLFLAIDLDMKEFITHSNCQKVIENIWTRYHPNVMWYPTIVQILYFTPQILLLPFIYLLYIFVPCASFLKYWQAPMNKFLGHLVSYITFLALLFASVLKGDDQLGSRVPSLNGGLDVCVWLWVAGMIFDQIQVTVYSGLKGYKKQWWLTYDLIMQLTFVVSFVGRLASYIKSRNEGDEYKSLIRNLWPWNDPQLVSEAFFCFAVILAFGKLLYFVQGSKVLGPMLLSLSRMVYDVFQMLFLFLLIMFAFATAMARLNGYYENSERKDKPSGEVKKQPSAFEDFGSSFKTLFWNLFGYGEPEFADIVVTNNCTESACNVVKHSLTEGSAYVLYGIYHLLAVTTMLNMLIAMMSNSLNHIQENEDREWKFSRSRLWITYLNYPFLPPPLNLIPCPIELMHNFKWLAKYFCSNNSSDEVAKFSQQKGCYFEDEERRTEKREELLGRLSKRYWASQGDITDAEELTPEHLEQVKIDLLKEIQKLQLSKSRAQSRVATPILPRHTIDIATLNHRLS